MSVCKREHNLLWVVEINGDLICTNACAADHTHSLSYQLNQLSSAVRTCVSERTCMSL
jgi:hypothetical protein